MSTIDLGLDGHCRGDALHVEVEHALRERAAARAAKRLAAGLPIPQRRHFVFVPGVRVCSHWPGDRLAGWGIRDVVALSATRVARLAYECMGYGPEEARERALAVDKCTTFLRLPEAAETRARGERAQ